MISQLTRTGVLKILFLVANLGTSILVARRIGPEELGIFSIAQALAIQAGTIAMIFAPNFSSKKILDEKIERDQTIVLLVALNMAIACAVVFPMFLLVYIFTESSGLTTNASILIIALANAGNIGFVYIADFKQSRLHLFQFWMSVLNLILVAYFIGNEDTWEKYIIIVGVGYLLQCILQWINYKDLLYKKKISIRSMFVFLKGNIPEAKWFYYTAILKAFHLNIQIPILAVFVSYEDIGQYKVAASLTNAFQAILSIVPLFLYPAFIQAHDQSCQSLDVLRKKYQKLVFIFIFTTIPLILVIHNNWIALVYTEKFIQSVPIFKILAISKLVLLLSNIYMMALLALEGSRGIFIGSLISFAANVVVGVPAIILYGALGASFGVVFGELVFLIYAYVRYSQKMYTYCSS